VGSEINAIPLADNPELVFGVLTDGGVVAVDLLVAQYVELPVRAAVDHERLFDDAPTEPGRLDRLCDTRRRSIQHGPEPVPRGNANREHRI
jgi:hypothetical protein